MLLIRNFVNLGMYAGNVATKVRLGRHTTLTFVALALLFAGRCALAQATGVIQGKVTDSAGSPILGAVVSVHRARMGIRTSRSPITMAHFRWFPCPQGSYGVKISGQRHVRLDRLGCAGLASTGIEIFAGRHAGGARCVQRDGRAIGGRCGRGAVEV